MEANQSKTPSRDEFLKKLSNYSECIKPFIRVAQERYIAGQFMIQEQEFDFNQYCVSERKAAEEAKSSL